MSNRIKIAVVQMEPKLMKSGSLLDMGRVAI